jgi:hypothetical protein
MNSQRVRPNEWSTNHQDQTNGSKIAPYDTDAIDNKSDR